MELLLCDRHREQEFHKLFNAAVGLAYCHDINGLVSSMGMSYNASKWRLFIDSSKRSLKALLLYNGNMVASLPMGDSKVLSPDVVTGTGGVCENT